MKVKDLIDVCFDCYIELNIEHDNCNYIFTEFPHYNKYFDNDSFVEIVENISELPQLILNADVISLNGSVTPENDDLLICLAKI